MPLPAPHEQRALWVGPRTGTFPGSGAKSDWAAARRRVAAKAMSRVLPNCGVFPAITEPAQARACARTTTSWKPLRLPLRPARSHASAM